MSSLCSVNNTQLGDAQNESSIAWILRILPLLIPLVWPNIGREWWKVREQTLGQKERWRHGKRYGGNEGQGKDDVLQSKDHAKYGAQTHLFLLLPWKSFFWTAALIPQSSHHQFVLKNYKDKVDVSNMARLTALLLKTTQISQGQSKGTKMQRRMSLME